MTDAAVGDPRDELALRGLAERYASAVDRRDRELFLSVFHPDARLLIHNPAESEEPTSQLVGHPELAGVTERIGKYDRTYHLLGNSRFEVSGDTARGEVYCVAHHLTRASGGDTDDVMYIRYQDDARRGADGVWRIAERRLRVDWTDRQPVGRRD
jgi:hypothetical protein